MKLLSLTKLLHSCAYIVLACAGLLLASPAQAGPVKWYCDCIPPDRAQGECKCGGYAYEMKRSSTRQFQGRCTQINTQSNLKVYPNFVDIIRGNGVSCTINAINRVSHPYVSKNCTHWGAISRQSVYMTITCTAKESWP